MSYLGDFRLGDTFDTKFTTVTTTGAPTALASGTVVAYPGNSTTEVTGGITLSADFDGRTGLNNVRVVATSGNGYATATNYQLVLSVGTVGGTSVVGYVIAEFSIEARSAVMPTTAARTLDVSATGEAGVDWANVGSPTTSLALTGTTIATTQKVDLETIKTNPVVNAGTVTFPTTATLASTTNITAGTVTTATNLTNAPTAGDFTATMKTSIGTAVAASAVASVTGNVGGNVTGSVGSVVGAVGSVTGAVGSVTGNVGGNVVGSVASVTAAVAITSNVKKNQALTKFAFLMTDSTTHAPATGKTVTCTRSIDGAAFGAGTLANVAEVASGIYTVDFGSGDLNGNVVILRATAASCDDRLERLVTAP